MIGAGTSGITVGMVVTEAITIMVAEDINILPSEEMTESSSIKTAETGSINVLQLLVEKSHSFDGRALWALLDLSRGPRTIMTVVKTMLDAVVVGLVSAIMRTLLIGLGVGADTRNPAQDFSRR